MPQAQTDFLLIGQGIAGSILAFSLLRAGYSVRVIDNHHKGSASQVAAGIINPVTGHRLNITDRFEEYSKYAEHWYTSLEQELGAVFYRPIKQQRLIKNAGQASYFTQRLTQADYQTILSRSSQSPFSDNALACADVARTAVVDTVAMVASVKQALLARAVYHSEHFDYSKLSITEHQCHYQDWQAKHIIFCEGYQAINNPWLKDLPFKLAKGEIITVKTEQPNDRMLSWGNWLVPAADKPNYAKLGANYAWNDVSLETDPAIQQSLLDSLSLHTGQTASVVQHQVGIRPTTAQRQPFIGPLTNLPNTYCFNGFGSKGCLTIPYYAATLCEHLQHGTELSKELSQWL
ncbi:NAD(P)/FAD-dependent oxidoreductase [Arenicella xantha]|uniref:Glycine/D-amino acid oxidase-like deaminating enzyme n=1 Tax=Arenicella xantha TaxID=644221 RepID=A0A395JIJ8_9GAMM|nr:FAD-dependent oxidoreductase [Arenicella xantha]RBP49599.1 glycine/D-amino acid oxidase-like deaminating enzyme [Arenicella xantha]